jgi:hypothetical protein
MSSYVEGFRSGSNTINLRWGDFLTVVTAKHLAIQYTAAVDSYTIWAVDGPDTYVCALVFAAASANYPFPYPDGYTATQNNTDVGVFTATYLASANTVALSSVGATGATAPLSANLIGIEVSGDLQAVSASNPLPITGTIMAPNPSVSTIGAATPGYATYIGGRDATGSLSAPGIADAGSAATTSQNALVVALSPSSPLPAGSNALGSVSISSGSVTVSSGTITSITDPVAVTGTFWQATQPVSGTVTANAGTGTFAISAASLPLPTGAATQTTLASILTNTPALGQATMAGSSPVVIASDQSAIPVTLTSTTVTGTVAVTQSTSPWIVAGGGTAGAPGTAVLTVQGISGGTAIPISGTVTANNASVSATGSGVPADATYIGGLSTGGNLTAPGITLASTAATAAQQALVVALSPNSPLPAGSNALGSVSVTGTVTVSGTVAVTQSTSPWVTQDTSDGSVSGGTAGTTSLLAGLVHHTAAPTLTNGQQASLQGDASGNLLVNLNTPLPAGSNLIGSVSISTPNTATYRAATFTLTTAATPTDILTIQGSSTKTVTITRISISGTQTQAGNALVRLIKRSTANTGGTAAALTNVPLDSNNSAATAVVSAYTANATLLGTATGDIDDVQVFVPDATTNPAATVLNFGTYAQAAVLRGTSQFLCLNLNGVTMTGNGLNISVEWTEM